MVDPIKIIEFPRGKYISTDTAAEVLKVGLRRVRQFIEEGTLPAIQFEGKGPHYIALKDFEEFAKIPRRPAGRPKTKLEVEKKAEKKGKR
jgi:excisionase family DNA binding protein